MNAPDVLGFYAALGIDLPDRPGNVSIRCFLDGHEDRHASASVRRADGVWHCWSCGGKGGPYRAALELGLAPRDAAELCKRFGVWLDNDDKATPSAQRPAPKPNPLEFTPDDAARWHRAFMEDRDTVAWLERNRGWNRDALAPFGIGLDPDHYMGPVTIPTTDATGRHVGVLHYQPNKELRDASDRKTHADGPRQLFPAPEVLRRLVDEGRFVVRDGLDAGVLAVVEGEPAALRLLSLGIPAVGVPGARNWRSHWVDRFAGWKPIAIPDCDEVGRTAMSQISEDLARVSETRLIDIDPSANGKYDVDDWLAEAGDEGPSLLCDAIARTKPIESNGAQLLAEVLEALRRYIVFPSDAEAVALALWVVHTHAIEAAQFTPYPLITSPEPECGKTQLFEVLAALVRSPWTVIEPTEAVLYRKIDRDRPTLLLDELDAVFDGRREKEPLRAILNAANKRGTTVPRCRGPNRDELVDFDVFCAKAFAGIEKGKYPATLRSRAIPIELQREPGGTDALWRDGKTDVELVPLRDAIEEWVGGRLDDLRAREPEFPKRLGGRARNIWEPLLAIADLAGSDWPARARSAALELSRPREEGHPVQLLRDIRTIFDEDGGDAIHTHVVLEALNALDESPWGGYRRGEGIDTRGVAIVLRRFRTSEGTRIGSHNVMVDGKQAKAWRRRDFEAAWAAYLPPDGSYPRAEPSSRPVGHGERENGRSSSVQVDASGRKGIARDPASELALDGWTDKDAGIAPSAQSGDAERARIEAKWGRE